MLVLGRVGGPQAVVWTHDDHPYKPAAAGQYEYEYSPTEFAKWGGQHRFG